MCVSKIASYFESTVIIFVVTWYVNYKISKENSLSFSSYFQINDSNLLLIKFYSFVQTKNEHRLPLPIWSKSS
jgi:hypothetical protein